MTDETEVPEEADVTPEQKAYRDAYDAVVANHEITPVTRDEGDRQRKCSCGVTGDVLDIQGHWGEEADRAGKAAVDAL